jgi:hypothetical protein
VETIEYELGKILERMDAKLDLLLEKAYPEEFKAKKE